MNKKSLRLSFFNLKKNKRECFGILFMTLVTAMMLSIVLVNKEKIDTSFDESFRSSGSAGKSVAIKKDKYRNIFKDVLTENYDVKNLSEGTLIYALTTDTITPDGDTVSYNFAFTNEKTERKIESFTKHDKLPDEKIAALEHPIWLPEPFQIVKGYEVGSDFTVLDAGREYKFTIAGFYETGLYCSDGYTYKLIISDEDYALFANLFDAKVLCGEYKVLCFDAGEDFDYEEYMEKCSKEASEDINFNSMYACYEYEKSNESQFLEIFMFMLIFLSLVTMVAALFMIRHKITGDIEDQMQRIGVLEALGYRSREISLAYLYEYVILGGLGAVIGTVIAILITPYINMMIESMLGRKVVGAGSILGAFIAAVIVLILVILFALMKARTIKKYPPVIALRKGIKSHHFRKNIMPLEKMKTGVNTGLGIKGFFGNIKASIGICICIIASGTAILFAAMTFDFFKNGADRLLGMMVMDYNALEVSLISGIDNEEIAEEMRKLPQVRKVLKSYLYETVSVKNSSDSAALITYDDFNDSDVIKPFTGVLPKRDNEVMIGMRRSKEENRKLGDSIILSHDGLEKSYVITGIVGTMMNGGSIIYMTNDGYERLNINASEDALKVYPAEGVSHEELEKAIKEHFGGTAKEVAGAGDGTDDEAKIREAAAAKIGVLLNQYGVTNVDYAVQIGDKLIKGNSRGIAIKDIISYDGITKTQMDPIAKATKTFTIIALILIAVIVAVLLMIITSNDVRRQRQDLGIMKAIGYSSKDLMKQLAIKYLPVIIFGTVVATVCAIKFNQAFWAGAFATIAETSIPVIIITDVLIVLFCYIVTYISAGKVRKISVTELMTE